MSDGNTSEPAVAPQQLKPAAGALRDSAENRLGNLIRHQRLVENTGVAAQLAFQIAALTGAQEGVRATVVPFRQGRDAFVGALNRIG